MVPPTDAYDMRISDWAELWPSGHSSSQSALFLCGQWYLTRTVATKSALERRIEIDIDRGLPAGK